MSRFPRTLSLILTLGLFLASCRPQTADRRPQADGGQPSTPSPVPTLTPTPAPTLTPTFTPTPTPDLAEVLGAPAEVARVEMVNENLALGYDADGNLVSWYGAKDRLWHTGQELRFVPEIMQMHGEPVPAIIEFVAEEGSQDAEAVKGKLREINPRGNIRLFHSYAGVDMAEVILDPAVLVWRKTEEVTLFPGNITNEEILYQVDSVWAYLAGGKVHLIQLPARGIVNTVVDETYDQFYLLTPESIQKLLPIGSRRFVSFFVPVDTSRANLDEWHAAIEGECRSYSPASRLTACFYNEWESFRVLYYSSEAIESLIYGSSAIVRFEGDDIVIVSIFATLR